MAQTVCVLLDAADTTRLTVIAEDRSRPLKHIQRARIVLLSAERLSVQDVARRAGVSRPAVWRWQRRYAEAGVEGLLRDNPRRSHQSRLVPGSLDPGCAFARPAPRRGERAARAYQPELAAAHVSRQPDDCLHAWQHPPARVLSRLAPTTDAKPQISEEALSGQACPGRRIQLGFPLQVRDGAPDVQAPDTL